MQVIEKVSDILNLMSSNPNKKYWRGTEISNELNMNISTVHRLMQSLKHSGFVNQDSETKKYILGMNFVYYAEVVRDMNIPGSVIYPLMQKLYDEIGETVFVTIKEGDSCIVIERINSHHQLRLVKQIGETILLCNGTCGKVILAYLPNEIRERIINQSLVGESLRIIIDDILKKGYLVEFVEEFNAKIFSAPIFSKQGKNIASISVAVPNCRLTEELSIKIISLLKDINKELE